jgi:hypothetical protein
MRSVAEASVLSRHDTAGDQWTFSETIADMAPEEWGGVSIPSA